VSTISLCVRAIAKTIAMAVEEAVFNIALLGKRESYEVVGKNN
jgi:hypothetical protein